MLVLALACSSAGADSGSLPGCATDVAPGTRAPAGTLDPGCACDPPAVEAGTGVLTFAPLEDGDDLAMVHGPQGGWHLVGAVRLENFRSVVDVSVQAWIGEVPITSELTYRNVLEPDGVCAGTLLDLYLYLDTHWLVGAGEPSGTPAELMACRTATLELCALDSDGRQGCDAVDVVVQPDRTDLVSGHVSACP